MTFSAQDPTAPPIARRFRTALWFVLAGILLVSFLGSLSDIRQSPGTDLRSRVVGARSLMRGMDPYFTVARTDQIASLQDPDRYAAACTRCTYAPTLLYLYMPLANLPYQTQRYIWFGLEWCALATSIWLLGAILPGQLIRNIFTTVAILFFAAGAFWRLHLERGQYYVLIVLLMSMTAWLCLRRSAADRWYSGIPLGIAAAFRLTPLAALPPLWISGYRRTALGAALAAAGCVAVTVALSGIQPWRSYFRSVSIQSRLIFDHDFFVKQQSKLPPLPATVEGVTFKRRLELPCADVTFAMDILQPLSRQFAWIPGRDKWQPISRGGAILTCGLFCLAIWRRKLTAAEKIAAAFLCALSIDFFLPARISYVDVMFLLPIALLLPSMLQHRRGYFWLAITLLSLILCQGFLPWQIPISLLRPPLLMIAMLTYLAIRIAGSGHREQDQIADPSDFYARAA